MNQRRMSSSSANSTDGMLAESGSSRQPLVSPTGTDKSFFQRAFAQFTPPKIDLENQRKQITFKDSLRFFFFGDKANLLLVFVPLGVASRFAGWSPAAVFFLNFFAIIPLSKMLGTATEEIALHTNDVLGGLLNATFGNAVELIISVIALNEGLIRVVQASLLGSIISNLLLVCGFCFLLGGFKYREQVFNVTSAQTSSSMLALTVMATMIPAAYSSVAWDDDEVNKDKVRQSVIHLSRATSVILLGMYCLCLYFQLKTHRYLLDETPYPLEHNEFATVNQNNAEEEDEEESHMTMPAATISLLFVTIIIAVLAEFLVGSIEGFSENLGLSETFIGIILVPIVGNAAEHVSAVSVAMKNKMDLALSVAIGSSTQIAMFVTPLMVVIGWILNENMTLDFHTFESVVLFLTVFITNYLIQDGKSNWLEGAMLLAGYLIIALAFFYYP